MNKSNTDDDKDWLNALQGKPNEAADPLINTEALLLRRVVQKEVSEEQYNPNLVNIVLTRIEQDEEEKKSSVLNVFYNSIRTWSNPFSGLKAVPVAASMVAVTFSAILVFQCYY